MLTTLSSASTQTATLRSWLLHAHRSPLHATRCSTPLNISRNLPRFTGTQRAGNASLGNSGVGGRLAEPTRLSFRQQVYRHRPSSFTFEEGVRRPAIGRHIAFAAFGTVTTFAVAAQLTNSDTDKWDNILSVTPWRKPTSDDMNRARFLDFFHKLQRSIEGLRSSMASWPHAISDLVLWSYGQLANTVVNGGDGRRITFSICAANAAVFLAWQVPRLQPFMQRAFLHHPLSGVAYTLLTSVFSHQSLMHFLFNSAALISFGSATVVFLRQQQSKNAPHMKESTPKYHFFAFFVAAGLFSSLVAHIAATRIRFPRAIQQLSTVASETKPTGRTLFRRGKASTQQPSPSALAMPFLGASGAIYAAVTLTALAFPTAQVALFFLPGFSMPISVGVAGMVIFDVLGIIRGWTFFAHYAHLGGAVFGMVYHYYGPRVWIWFRSVMNTVTTSITGPKRGVWD